MLPSLDREFLFVSGKGGVGKTTVAAALAVALSRRGRRTLLVLLESDPGSRLLGGPEASPERIERSARGPWVTVAEAESALAQYGGMVLKSRAAFEALFENRYGRTFLRAVPGLYQWAQLGKAWFHSQEREPTGARRFDTVILDAPATGHALEMLRVPKLLTEIAPVGLLRRDADSAWQTFVDAKRSGVVLVTLAEELAVSETLEFVTELEGLSLPIARVVVNALLEPIFSGSDHAELLAARERVGPGERELVEIAAHRATREGAQREQLQRLDRACAHPQSRLPWVESAAAGNDPEALVGALLADAERTPTDPR